MQRENYSCEQLSQSEVDNKFFLKGARNSKLDPNQKKGVAVTSKVGDTDESYGMNFGQQITVTKCETDDFKN